MAGMQRETSGELVKLPLAQCLTKVPPESILFDGSLTLNPQVWFVLFPQNIQL